jgi:hypothetical protein
MWLSILESCTHSTIEPLNKKLKIIFAIGSIPTTSLNKIGWTIYHTTRLQSPWMIYMIDSRIFIWKSETYQNLRILLEQCKAKTF